MKRYKINILAIPEEHRAKLIAWAQYKPNYVSYANKTRRGIEIYQIRVSLTPEQADNIRLKSNTLAITEM